MPMAPSSPMRTITSGGACQRSDGPRVAAMAAITAADSDQRTTDRVAGPKDSFSARPMTGLSAKKAGTRARSSQLMGRVGVRRQEALLLQTCRGPASVPRHPTDFAAPVRCRRLAYAPTLEGSLEPLHPRPQLDLEAPGA